MMIIKWVSCLVLVFAIIHLCGTVPIDLIFSANINNSSNATETENTKGDSFEITSQQNISFPIEDETTTTSKLNDTKESEDAVKVANFTGKSGRRGRFMNLDGFLNLFKPLDLFMPEPSAAPPPPLPDADSKSNSIQSRILTGGGPTLGASLDELASNTFSNDNIYSSSATYTNPLGKAPPKHISIVVNNNDKYDSALTGQSAVKTYQPQDRFASVSYSNPAVPDSGPSSYEPSDLVPYYHDGSGYFKSQHSSSDSSAPVLYQLVPVKPTVSSYTFSEAVKDTLFKVKDHVSGTVQKVKNALGFHGFSEKVATPDTLMAVAPVAAGLLAGGLAVAYLAGKAGPKNNNTSPFNIFGKRSVRNVITEEDLNTIVARLDPVQREYLQKLQLYGPQRWKDVTCAKYIFCDVMSRATPLHVMDMQRKIGVFLSRMDETTARYVEVILKDVMLAIQARDCSRFSCSQPTWGHPPPPPPPPPPQVNHPFQFFPGSNFLRRQ